MIHSLILAGTFMVAAQAAQPGSTAPPPTSQQPAPKAAPPSAAEVAQLIQAEFPKYDKDGNGRHGQAEFSTWVLTLRTASPQPPMPEAESQAWVAEGFKQADADRDGSVSKAEMAALLSGAK